MHKRFAKDTAMIAAGRLSTQLSGFLLLPLYTHFMPPSEYGVGDWVVSLAILLSPLILLSLDQGCYPFLVSARSSLQQQRVVISSVMAVGIPAVATFLVTGVLISLATDSSLVAIATVYFCGAVAVNLLQWIARGMGRFKSYAVGSLLIGSMTLLSGVYLVALRGEGALGMLLSITIANVLGCTYWLVNLGVFANVRMSFASAEVVKAILRVSIPLIPNAVSWWLVAACDRTVILAVLGSESAGVYSTSLKFGAIVAGLFSIFGMAWHEVVVSRVPHNPDSEEGNQDAIFSELIIFMLLAIGIALPIISLNFEWLVGPEFASSRTYIPLLMVGAGLATVAAMYGSFYVAQRRTAAVMVTTLAAVVVNLVVIFAAISSWGLMAVASSSVAAYLLMVVTRRVHLRSLGVTLQVDHAGVAIAACAVALSIGLYYMQVPGADFLSLAIDVIAAVALLLRRFGFAGIVSRLKSRSTV